MPSDQDHDTVIWLDADRADLVQRVVHAMGNAPRVVGIGGPRQAQINQLAKQLACPHEDDIRKLLIDHPAKFLLLASMQGVGPSDALTAIEQGFTVLTLEPIVSDISQPALSEPLLAAAGAGPSRSTTGRAAPGAQPPLTSVVWLPAFERSKGWVSAADPDLGPPQAVFFAGTGQPTDCSLFARLFDAWRTVLGVVAQLPERIDAALSGPLPEAPENPRGITGHINALARFANGATAAVQVSDRAAQLERTLQIISPQGHLLATDTGYQLFDAAGHRQDQSDQKPQAVDYATLVASHWKDLISDTNTAKPPTPTTVRDASVLACCMACLLSARTTQPESPAMLLKLHAR